MRKGTIDLVSKTPTEKVRVTRASGTGEYDDEEDGAMIIGGEPRPTQPVVLSADDSRRVWELVTAKEPVVLTERMKEAIANYKRVMSEVVD